MVVGIVGGRSTSGTSSGCSGVANNDPRTSALY